MRHTFLVVTVEIWLKSVYIYRSYRKIKTGVPLFMEHSVEFTYQLASNVLLQQLMRPVDVTEDDSIFGELRRH